MQAIHDTNAHDGDTITLPAGTFIWITGVSLTKGVTVRGQTTITGAGTANCTANDQTIIIDEIPRGRHLRLGQPRRRPRGTAGALFKATIRAGKSFRLTGITFKKGSITQVSNGGAVRILSTGLVQSARIDHCHFDHLYWGHSLQIGSWIYGVDDHNLYESNGNNISHLIHHNSWGGSNNGNGSWADYPYYGSEKFWFMEDNTIKGSGSVGTSGGVDCQNGGRYVARHNYFQNTSVGGHGTEGGPIRGQRCDQVYNNTFNWTIGHGGHAHRSGSTIWHDNTFLGKDPGSHDHTNLPVFRQLGLVSNDLSNWGFADGDNGWDKNDPHGIYLSGTAASNTTIRGASGTFTIETPMRPHAYRGMQVRNDHVGSACYLHSAYISDNTATRITYYYGGPGRGAPLVFHSGDAFSIRKVLIALDQNGRGKGDVIAARGHRKRRTLDGLPRNAAPGTRHWPNQQQETCFSWNNKNTDTGQVYGIKTSIPTEHEGSDYINLGAGLPANQIPAQVTAAYPASVNGGSAYNHEYPYPHHLVTGGPTPTPTVSPTPTATVTATATP